MPRALPPLTAFRAFEAAARVLSFTRAASELGMTQAAVSYQIRVLEERAGTPLFLRERRQVVLTDAGRVLAEGASTALDTLAEAFEAVKGDAAGVLTIGVIPTFATRWLARHLYDFQLNHPGIAVRLHSTRDVGDFGRDPLDVAIRACEDPNPTLIGHRLVRADFSPMVSPALEARIGRPLHEPADLLHYPLIDPTDPWWNDWFRHAGVERAGFEVDNGHKMGGQDLEAVAALSGHGVAILTPFFYGDDLAAERLRQPFDIVCPSERSYWLCYPPSRRNVPKVRLFRDWLLGHFPDAGHGLPRSGAIG